jgi:cytoskeletal protein RodZ
MALIGVLGLVLGGYALRAALRPTDLTPGTGTTVAAAPEPETTTPTPTTEPESTTKPETTTTEPTTEETTTTQETPESVSVNLHDYLLRPGNVAAATATERGLEPVVIDEQGDKIDSDHQSECWITNVNPPFGSLPPGSPLELTCTEH